MSASIDITKLIRSLQGEVKRRAMAAAKRGLDQAGEMVLTQAKLYCPKDTGDLTASGVTEPAQERAGGLRKVIGFGERYAAAVHENIGASFNTTKNPLARSKFLESAMRESTDKVAAHIAAQIRKVL
jgi:hypothetical protein